MIKMLRALVAEIEVLQEQTGTVNREGEILRKNQKELLKV